MDYKNADHLIRELSGLGKTASSKRLAEFYSTARFNLDHGAFLDQFTDGENDGGIDFYHIQGNSFYIFQSKFSGKPKKNNEDEIMHEMDKIVKTLAVENTNTRAESFVNSLKRSLHDEKASLEIVWLTTNTTEQSLRETIQKNLKNIRQENSWTISTEFVAIDKNDLEGVIFDFDHGHIPQTGKRTVGIQYGKWIEKIDEETGVYYVVCTINANDILQWFDSLEEIDNFLQKNVRGFLGQKGINEGIRKSYEKSPQWFWYKHNGIIIFADSVEIDETREELIMRNPQIVNGGQTLKVLYVAYDKSGRKESSAEILLRAYRLPYDHTETYETSVDIIEALNSQNKILSSDLRSNDFRQVRLERLLAKRGYKYHRKRAKGIKSTKSSIPMWRLAPVYYCCKKHAPHLAVAMHVQELFREKTRYNDIFNQDEISREPDGQHVLLKYITAWNLYQILQERRDDLPDRDWEYFQYTQFFVLADMYEKLMDWKNRKFSMTWKSWIDFAESEEFWKQAWKYAKTGFAVGSSIIPQDEEPRSFFRSRASTQKFNVRTGRQKFGSLMNQAFRDFKRESV